MSSLIGKKQTNTWKTWNFIGPNVYTEKTNQALSTDLNYGCPIDKFSSR